MTTVEQPDRHRELIDEIADAIILVSPSDTVLMWSRAAEQLFGYSAEEACGASLVDLLVPSDRLDEHQVHQRQARESGVTLYETVRHRRDGSLLVVSVSVSAVKDQDGTLIHYVHSKRDVTRLTYRREADLLATQFRGLLNAAPDSMIAVNRDGYIILLNTQAERMFGYTRNELVGSPVETLVPERYRGHHRQHRNGYFAEPRQRAMGADLDLYGLRKDGTEFPVEISLSPLDTDSGPMTMSAIRDITDRRRAEARFRSLLEAAPDAIVIVKADGTITLVNAQTETVFGYSRDALLGQPVEMLLPARLRNVHGAHRRHYFAEPRQRAMGAELELYGLRQDGTEFPVEISLSPLESEDGILTISAIRDVTQQKATAQRARLLAQEQAARVQAEAAVKTRTEFLSVAAHELKTPITSLRIFATLLIRQLDERGAVNPDRLRLALKTIDQQSDKLSRLINQLLDISRIEAGRLGLSRERSDLTALGRAVATAAQATTQRHTISVYGGPVVTDVDVLRFEQVLTNLLDNAIKYSPDGGEIHLTVEAATPDTTQITVRDHGIGISDELRDRIFDRFFRVDESGPTSGMGLGLFISRQIVELHGGEIAADRAHGGGTRFVITMPSHAEGGT